MTSDIPVRAGQHDWGDMQEWSPIEHPTYDELDEAWSHAIEGYEERPLSETAVLGTIANGIADLRAENRKLRDALIEIRDQQGKVCDNYELCNHESCRSSYASWAIASRALERGE